MADRLSDPVLVLNANFEPLNVCSIRRAVGLMIKDKASMILNGRGMIKTTSNAFPCPSIIRLQNMIKRPRPTVKLNKREVFRRDRYTCQYCGKKSSELTVDHIVPKHLGGLFTWENLITACAQCNLRKGGKSLMKSNMALLSKPKAPSASAEYIFGRYLIRFDDWQPFIKGW